MTNEIPFGKYRLLEKLATGAVAEIYRALTRTAEGQDLTVVIKRIRPELAQDLSFANQFIDEARIMAMIQHPNIARIYEWGRQDDALFIAMEYIEGTNLASLMQSRIEQSLRFPPMLAVHIASEVLQALHYAHGLKDAFGHSQKLVHRDICPANILLSSNGEVKLVDFGLAKATSRVQGTRPGIFAGKYTYRSPEHAAEGEIDGRSDIYSLGVVLYELLTGSKLHAERDTGAADIVRAIQQRPPSSIHADIPADLDALVLRTVSLDPAARPPSAMDLRTELLTFLNRWDRQVDADALSSFLVETLSERKSGTDERVGFAFGEATSHWFARGDELVKADAEELEDGDAEGRAKRERFAAGSTVMAVEAADLGTGRHTKAWLLVGGIACVMALVTWMVVSGLGDKGKPTVKIVEPEPRAEGFAGAVEIKTTPAEVLIFVDGDLVEPMGNPPRLMSQRAGKRRIRLMAPGYLPWEGDLVLEKDKPSVLDQTLVERKGKLVLQSQPPKALIFLDGKKAGRTPTTIEDLSAATTHKVVLRARKFAPVEFEIKPADWPEDVEAALVVEKKLEKQTRKRRRRRKP
ncbi:MAG: serine/threonine protein kinase [Deltaproteobacteria bacterium]|nr:serine/threonine protein kinase [Deltaproteobacteria bacterium]